MIRPRCSSFVRFPFQTRVASRGIKPCPLLWHSRSYSGAVKNSALPPWLRCQENLPPSRFPRPSPPTSKEVGRLSLTRSRTREENCKARKTGHGREATGNLRQDTHRALFRRQVIGPPALSAESGLLTHAPALAVHLQADQQHARSR